jgi:hypothetical protein
MKHMTILSLGAGVQSTTLALMAAQGLLKREDGTPYPMTDCAIFADTGWEPKRVYEHLEKLRQVLPYPVYVVKHSNIREDLVNGTNSGGKKRFASVPFFMRNPDGSDAMGRRQCTGEYKLKPLYAKTRELLGYAKGKRIPANSVTMLIGISLDESHRMKPAQLKYVRNAWPLIDMRMTRTDCKRWMRENGWEAPKSSCIGCPFHNNAMWRDMKINHPEEWADAVEMDKIIRKQGKIKAEQFMHRSLKPLDEVDLRNSEDMGQIDMFGNECEGMCGV